MLKAVLFAYSPTVAFAQPVPTPPPITPTNTDTAAAKDCFQCRVIGTATLGGSAVYVLYQQQQIPKGTRLVDRVSLALFGAALGVGAVWRWFVE